MVEVDAEVINNASDQAKAARTLLDRGFDFDRKATKQQLDALKDCFAKVSLKAIHNFLIQPLTSWNCLHHIHARTKEPKLISRLTSVLLGCAYNSTTGCLITIMKDRTRYPESRQKSYVPIPGPPFTETLPGWQSFETLVDDLLLPLAQIDVVHNDIRFNMDTKRICNVLCIKDERAEDGERADELMVIDFESLAIYEDCLKVAWQSYAVSVMVFGRDGSAFHVLFWQLLWVAYVWHPGTTKENVTTANGFIEQFFSETETIFNHFKESVPWSDLKASWGKLRVSWAKQDQEDCSNLSKEDWDALVAVCKNECATEIQETMRLLREAFPEKVSKTWCCKPSITSS